MRICFVGKGGSGKTTVSSQFSHYVLKNDKIKNRLVIDADHNQHLKKYLDKYNYKGLDIRTVLQNIDTEGLIKTSLPKKKENIISLENFLKKHKIDFLYSGSYDENKTGSGCYHGQIGKIELLLTHIIDTQNDIIISDMTAGSDIFGSSYFVHFDIIVGVCEPTYESISVIKEIQLGLVKYGINFKIIANKVFDDADKTFILKHFNEEDILGYIKFQRLRNKDESIKIPEDILKNILTVTQKSKKNWQNFQNNLNIFHNKNINSWAKGIKPHSSNLSYKDIATEIEG